MVRAGEIGGFLELVLERLSEYLERGQQLRDEVRSALTYPVLLVCAMGVSILVLLIYVLPKFTVMFSEMGRALPLQARVLLAVSEAVGGYWWAGIGAVGLVAGSVRYSLRTPRGRYEWDQWKLRLALVGPLLRSRAGRREFSRGG